jgi:glycerophosphoryl diester phosphodiesterase
MTVSSYSAWLTERPIAHRGLHNSSGRVENTIAAFEAAIERNFAIECDVMLCADETVIVFHDNRLERMTTATGDVHAYTFNELKQTSLRASNERIPSLHELLEVVDGKVPIIVELKSPWPRKTPLAQKVAEALDGYQGSAAVMSFDPRLLMQMRKYAPHLPRGMVADHFDRDDWPELPTITRFGSRHMLGTPFVSPSFIAYNVLSLPAPAPSILRSVFKLPTLAWTVRTPDEYTHALRHADQIIFEDYDPDAD